MNVHLNRFCYGIMGTFSVLSVNDFSCYTVEKPWAGNTPYISCIPEGIYACKRIQSPKFGEVFEVTKVKNRTHILIHKGNTMDDVTGCIAPGERLGCLGGKWAVLASTEAFKYFMYVMAERDSFNLMIDSRLGDS